MRVTHNDCMHCAWRTTDRLLPECIYKGRPLLGMYWRRHTLNCDAYAIPLYPTYDEL